MGIHVVLIWELKLLLKLGRQRPLPERTTTGVCAGTIVANVKNPWSEGKQREGIVFIMRIRPTDRPRINFAGHLQR